MYSLRPSINTKLNDMLNTYCRLFQSIQDLLMDQGGKTPMILILTVTVIGMYTREAKSD